MSAGFNDRIVRSRNANEFLGSTSRIVSGNARMASSFSSRAKTVFLRTSCLPIRKSSAGSSAATTSRRRLRPFRFPDLDRHDGRIQLGIADLIRLEELAGLQRIDPAQERHDRGGVGFLLARRSQSPSLSAPFLSENVSLPAWISIWVTAAGSMSATCWLRRATALFGTSARALASTMTTSSWSPWRT